MVNTDELESTVKTGILTSDAGKTSQYVLGITPAKFQGTDEVELFASFSQVLPLRMKGGKIEQNLLFYNVYVIPQRIIDSVGYNLESFISRKLSEIAEIEYIFTSKEQNILHVWIVMNRLDREARDKIYHIEYGILEKFKDNYFDFHVICRDDRDINDLFPSKAIMIYRST